jgi:SAM-dependent methyltransferase
VSYDQQDRGSAEDYAAYFAGMNASMQQKVALTTAHFPPEGIVADMGSGSGQATHDLAALYAGLQMVGVDINPKSVAISEQTYRRKNLRFVTGDIADPIFAKGTLAGILNSSVLHHVTSFSGFQLQPVTRLLDNQVAELKDGGVLIIRDFVIPRGPELCDLELLEADTPALFLEFARTWKSSQSPVRYEQRGPRTFRLPLRAAAEFVLRKDYKDHWATELLEEYTYFSQQDFERAFTERGLRIVVSCELYNPWIVEHRYVDKIRLSDVQGRPLPYPPTNYLIVGEKVKPKAGVRLLERDRRSVQKPAFLSISGWRRKSDGRVFELAERPKRTIDVLPWFVHQGRAFIVAKRDFPRPVSAAAADEPDLIGMSAGGYLTEPIAAIVGDTDPAQAAREILAARAGITEVLSTSAPWRYFTSPGGINERVDAYLCEIAPWLSSREVDNYSSFSASGSVRYLDAAQTLRACHVGGMFDSRLELNVYRLCLETQRACGPWIGAAITLADGPAVRTMPAKDAFAVPKRQAFERCELAETAFLDVRAARFEELDAAAQTVSRAELEYVTPKSSSKNTVTLLPALRRGRDVYVGLEVRDLPAVQAFEGTSAIVTVPACRLPRGIVDLDGAERFAREKLGDEFALQLRKITALGGRYYPSVGVTPEVVYPMLGEVGAVSAGCSLAWVSLADAIAHCSELRDAHLLTSLLRLRHALL